MSHESHNPTDRLAAWGKAQQQTPSRDLEMKNVALFSLKPTPRKTYRHFHWAQYVMSVVTVFGVLGVIGLQTLNQMRMATSSGSIHSFESSVAPVAYNSEIGDVEVAQDVVYNSAARQPFLEQPIEQFKKSVADTREFLKTYYRATLRTREVAKVATHIQTIARGYGGRVDDISVNKEFAHISFVVPKNKFDAFTEEMRGLVRPKFIEENISAENLLPQKQVIEKQTVQVVGTVEEIQAEREELIKKHDAKVVELQSKINSFNPRIANARQQYANATSTEEKLQFGDDVKYWVSQQMYAKKQLNQENAEFGYALSAINANLSVSQQRLDGLYQADENLLANVETVEASVSLQWIGVWEIIELYVPIYWILSIVGIVGVIGYFKYGRRLKLPLL